MNFFEHQDHARQWTTRLVLMFLVAVGLIVFAVNVGVGFTAYLYMATKNIDMVAHDSILGAVDGRVYVYTTLAVLGVIAFGTIKRMRDIAGGGKAVAEMVGGRRVDRFTEVPAERRLLNVVDEMAIASGISSPAVYIMDKQRSINAFAAGFSPSSAVIAVTSGTLEALNRAELQGVIAHEFSHILNGDMRLNIRLLGIMNGITYIGTGGAHLLHSRHPGLMFAGMIMAVAGYTGVFFAQLIKAGVSRQREFLADASAVQFTRNPNGIANALSKIYMLPYRTIITNRYSEELSHMFFSKASNLEAFDFMATHPPLTERIKRIKPRFDLDDLNRNKQEKTDLLYNGLIKPEEINKVFLGLEDTTVDPMNVVDSIGAPTALHLAYAAALLESVPRKLFQTMETSEGVQAAFYALVIEGKTRQAQFKWLRDHVYDELADRSESLWQPINALDKRYRLPILDIGLPVLKTMTQAQKDEFVNNIESLIRLDRKVTLDEYVVHALVRQQLGNKSEKAIRIRHINLASVTPECVLVLSLLAYAGSRNRKDIEQAFAKGARALQMRNTKLLDKRFIKLKDVEAALVQLRKVAFRVRKQLVTACAKTAMADGHVHTREAELLRTVAEVLECPMPPILDNSMLEPEAGVSQKTG